MKKAAICVLLWSLFSFACETKTFLKVDPVIAKPDTPPILEITKDRVGLWNIVGESLYFRLYDNGVVEFDLINESSDGTRHKTSELAQRLLVQLDPDRLELYKDAINSEQEPSSKYVRERCGTDAFINYKVKIISNGETQKEIALYGFCNEIDLGNPITPAPTRNLIELFKLIWHDREKAISRQPQN